MSFVTVIVDTLDVDVNCATEATPEIHRTLGDHVNQSNQVIATLAERIDHMQMVSVSVKNMSLDRDVISVLHHHST